MRMLTSDTFQRPADMTAAGDPAVLYARSYLLIRTAVGLIGILLPLALFLVDAMVLHGSIAARGSLSAYYHSGARDLFVGALCVTGCLLMTYMGSQPRTLDFWWSLVAGAAAVGVALFPTERPVGEPVALTPLQARLGEGVVSGIHVACAATFILSLAALCFVFAHREATYTDRVGRVRLHRTCGVVIVVAVAWAVLGFFVDLDLGWLTSLYLAEVVSVWAFGLSWLVKGYDLRALFSRVPGAGRLGFSPPGS